MHKTDLSSLRKKEGKESTYQLRIFIDLILLLAFPLFLVSHIPLEITTILARKRRGRIMYCPSAQTRKGFTAYLSFVSCLTN